MVVIIDYDIGNLGAVANMLRRLGADCLISRDPEHVEAADHLILPGNGAFDACVRGLTATGLVPLLTRRVLQDRVPLLGICVGAQMLGRSSEEGSEAGLGWMDFTVRRFPDLPGVRVPHMGWDEVVVASETHPLTKGLDAQSRFYFVHSYYIEPARSEDVLLTSEYGIKFAAGVAHENISGVQFHPEKSHRFGKQLLANFVRTNS